MTVIELLNKIARNEDNISLNDEIRLVDKQEDKNKKHIQKEIDEGFETITRSLAELSLLLKTNNYKISYEDFEGYAYESVIILNPNLSQQKIKNIITDIKILIEEDLKGKIKETEELGKKQLAYEIKKQKYGYYIRIVFKAQYGSQKLNDFERYLRVNDDVMKFITIKIED